MKKKIKIIIAIIICLIIICTCAFIITRINKSEGVQKRIIDESIKVQQIDDVKKVYNIGKYINEVIDIVYEEEQTGIPFLIDVTISDNHIELLEELGLKDTIKKFYIKQAYEVDLTEEINVFFVTGYLKSDNGIEQNIKLSVIKHNSYNVSKLDIYGRYYTDLFNYSENIDDTTVYQFDENTVSEYFVKDLDHPITTFDEEVKDIDLVYYYYEDYKNTGENIKEDTYLTRFKGGYEEGYTLVDNEGTQIFIKPGNTPMDYDQELIK